MIKCDIKGVNEWPYLTAKHRETSRAKRNAVSSSYQNWLSCQSSSTWAPGCQPSSQLTNAITHVPAQLVEGYISLRPFLIHQNESYKVPPNNLTPIFSSCLKALSDGKPTVLQWNLILDQACLVALWEETHATREKNWHSGMDSLVPLVYRNQRNLECFW